MRKAFPKVNFKMNTIPHFANWHIMFISNRIKIPELCGHGRGPGPLVFLEPDPLAIANLPGIAKFSGITSPQNTFPKGRNANRRTCKNIRVLVLYLASTICFHIFPSSKWYILTQEASKHKFISEMLVIPKPPYSSWEIKTPKQPNDIYDGPHSHPKGNELIGN